MHSGTSSPEQDAAVVASPPLDPPEIRDLRPRIGKMAFDSGFHLSAGLGSAVDRLKQAADFLDRKAEFAGLHDENPGYGRRLATT